jgi:Gram-negative porin
MKIKYLLALGGVSCAALLAVEPAGAQSAQSNKALEQKVEALEQQVKFLSDQVKASNEANNKAQTAAALSANAKQVVKTPAIPAGPTAIFPVVVPPNATLLDKKSRAAPNIIFEPLQPGMNLINDPNTWLGLYGTAEADVVATTRANNKGATRVGLDAAPWMSANRFGVTGAHTFDLDHHVDVIVRLEAEYQLPTGNQDTPGVLFNRDAWVGVQASNGES